MNVRPQGCGTLEGQKGINVANVLLVAEGTAGSIELYDDRIRIKRSGLGALLRHGLKGDKDIRLTQLPPFSLEMLGSCLVTSSFR